MTSAPGPGKSPRVPSAGLPPPDPGEAEDVAWILEFKSGREQGFNRLVLKHQHRVYGLCLRLLAADAGEAEDAAQEAFVRAYRGLKAFRMDAKFSSWMYRIAVNVCKNKLASRAWRDGKSHRDLESIEAEGLSASSPETLAPSPAQELDAKSKRARIEAAIARLPDEQRELVVLRDVEGRSYEEIAETTGLVAGTLKSRLNRGRAQLREWLKDCFLPLLLFALAWMMKDHG